MCTKTNELSATKQGKTRSEKNWMIGGFKFMACGGNRWTCQ